jgi:hypothetical protein
MIRIPISHRIKFNLETPAESSQKIHGIIFEGGKVCAEMVLYRRRQTLCQDFKHFHMPTLPL